MTPDEWEQAVEEWELDLLNRQRNIVFPDTVLNEARFFRNVVSGQIPLNLTQRLGVLLITAPFVASGCIGTAFGIGSLLTTQDVIERCLAIFPIIATMGQAGFGIIIIVRGLLATAPPTDETDEISPPTLPISES